MFNIGERVIFIGDSNFICTMLYHETELIYGKEYVIFDQDKEYIMVTERLTPSYIPSAFISIKEYRKRKLDKLCLNMATE